MWGRSRRRVGEFFGGACEVRVWLEGDCDDSVALGGMVCGWALDGDGNTWVRERMGICVYGVGSELIEKREHVPSHRAAIPIVLPIYAIIHRRSPDVVINEEFSHNGGMPKRLLRDEVGRCFSQSFSADMQSLQLSFLIDSTSNMNNANLVFRFRKLQRPPNASFAFACVILRGASESAAAAVATA